MRDGNGDGVLSEGGRGVQSDDQVVQVHVGPVAETGNKYGNYILEGPEQYSLCKQHTTSGYGVPKLGVLGCVAGKRGAGY